MEGGHFPMLERPSELADVLIANLEQDDDGGVDTKPTTLPGRQSDSPIG